MKVAGGNAHVSSTLFTAGSAYILLSRAWEHHASVHLERGSIANLYRGKGNLHGQPTTHTVFACDHHAPHVHVPTL